MQSKIEWEKERAMNEMRIWVGMKSWYEKFSGTRSWYEKLVWEKKNLHEIKVYPRSSDKNNRKLEGAINYSIIWGNLNCLGLVRRALAGEWRDWTLFFVFSYQYKDLSKSNPYEGDKRIFVQILNAWSLIKHISSMGMRSWYEELIWEAGMKSWLLWEVGMRKKNLHESKIYFTIKQKGRSDEQDGKLV